jgi:hypothetical protein
VTGVECPRGRNVRYHRLIWASFLKKFLKTNWPKLSCAFSLRSPGCVGVEPIQATEDSLNPTCFHLVLVKQLSSCKAAGDTSSLQKN